LKKEREHCCDDLVLQFKYDPHAYISALLSLAARQQPGHRLAVAATGSSDKLLLQRARRILLRQEGNRSRPGTRTFVLLLFTGLITALALYRPLLPAHRSTTLTARTRVEPTPDPAASPIEIAYSQPIHSTPPPLPKRIRVRPRTHTTREPAAQQADNKNVFINDAGEVLDDDNTQALAVSSDDLTDPGSNTLGTDTRDYSLTVPGAVTGAAISLEPGAPFVPNSSFLFQYIQGDSTRPEEKLLYLQQSAEHEVMAAMAKLQRETALQLRALSELQAKGTESVHLRHQIQTQQLKLQREYLKKIAGWQKKLKTTTHIRMIVYI
jgi:hypothetical protein